MFKKKIKDLFINTSKEQAKDSGMVLVFILLLLFSYLNNNIYLLRSAIIILIINMIYPSIFKPFAFFWFGLAKILNMFVPKILLSIVFFVFILPFAFMFRIFKRDLLYLKKFKKGSDSVFKFRNHKFIPE